MVVQSESRLLLSALAVVHVTFVDLKWKRFPIAVRERERNGQYVGLPSFVGMAWGKFRRRSQVSLRLCWKRLELWNSDSRAGGSCTVR